MSKEGRSMWYASYINLCMDQNKFHGSGIRGFRIICYLLDLYTHNKHACCIYIKMMNEETFGYFVRSLCGGYAHNNKK